MCLLRLSTLTCALFLVTGCAIVDVSPRYQDISYEHFGQFDLDVAEIDIVNEYRPPLRSPNVEHLFPMSPGRAAVRWAKDRLRPVGNVRKASFIVRHASVIETQLSLEEGVRGAITTEQAHRYEARLSIIIEIRSETRGKEAYVEAEAIRVRTLPENSTINERLGMFHAMTQELMADANVQLERNIRQYLTKFVR